MIVDNFKGQITPHVNAILEDNSTDLLQPMDLTINKPVKDFRRQKFRDWYTNEIAERLEKEPDANAAE